MNTKGNVILPSGRYCLSAEFARQLEDEYMFTPEALLAFLEWLEAPKRREWAIRCKMIEPFPF